MRFQKNEEDKKRRERDLEQICFLFPPPHFTPNLNFTSNAGCNYFELRENFAFQATCGREKCEGKGGKKGRDNTIREF